MKIYVGTLDHECREKLIRKYIKDVDHDIVSEDMASLGDRTQGWSGSDIEILCREAGRSAFNFIELELTYAQSLFACNNSHDANSA